jgi:hypothetical protein
LVTRLACFAPTGTLTGVIRPAFDLVAEIETTAVE